DRKHGAVRDEGGFRNVAGFCDDRAVDSQAVRQPVHQAVFDQYGISVGVLSGDGRDSGGMAAVGLVAGLRTRLAGETPALRLSNGNSYSITIPPVNSATRCTWCSAHQFSRSPAIFSVATGSQ